MIRCAVLVGTFAATIAVAAAACRKTPAATTEPSAVVERSRVERLVVATGTIEPEKEVDVRPRISGIVEQIHCKAGDTVTAGTPLLQIERELLMAQLAEAQARLQGARVGAREARNDLARASRLRTQGMIAEQEFERASSRADRADSDVTATDALVAALEVQIRYTTITAPLSGRILDVAVEEGSAVASVTSVTGGTRLLTIADTDRLHVKGLVDENEISWVSVGQSARVRTEGLGARSVPGVVRDIKPLGERQQNVTYFEVLVDILGAHDDSLRPRMSADVDIVTQVVDDALVVPETSLQYDGDVVFVERVVSDDGLARERRDVELGIVEGDRVQVVSGLAAGERVRLK